jgi:hypothetical protein
MKFILLLYGNEGEWAKASPEEHQRAMAEFGAVYGDLTKNGQYRGGDALQPASAAKTVRVRGGKAVDTDGPFAETKEQLGGYFVIEARDMAEATSIAARLPSARVGCVEVRPAMEVPRS